VQALLCGATTAVHSASTRVMSRYLLQAPNLCSTARFFGRASRQEPFSKPPVINSEIRLVIVSKTTCQTDGEAIPILSSNSSHGGSRDSVRTNNLLILSISACRSVQICRRSFQITNARVFNSGRFSNE
jgi:hypothetical protein